MPTPLTPSLLESFFHGLDLQFQEALQNQGTIWEKIASKKTSVHEDEVYGWLDLVPLLRKWYGPRVINQLSLRAQRLVNELYELTVGIRRTKLEDDTAGMYSDYVRMMGVSSKLWPENLVIAALKAASSTTVYDNQYFFDTDHPVDMDNPNSATQSNDIDYSSSGGLTSDNIADAFAKMRAFKGANGDPLDVNPNVLLVPPQSEYKAKQIFNATIIAQAVGSNAAAAIDNQLKGMADVVTSGRLADTPDYVYLLDCRMPVKPFIFQERDPAVFTPRYNPEDPHVFDVDEYLAGVRARGAAGYGPWWLAARLKIA